MNQGICQLAARIRQELKDIEYTLKRAAEGLEKARQNNDDLYLDGIALNLHGFYSGIERLLERIAVQVDGHLSQGANWHQSLILQMTDEGQMFVRQSFLKKSVNRWMNIVVSGISFEMSILINLIRQDWKDLLSMPQSYSPV